MKSTKAANRYAQSLLDLAKENGELDRVKDDMMLVRDTVAASDDLALMLTSPIIKSEPLSQQGKESEDDQKKNESEEGKSKDDELGHGPEPVGIPA